MLVTIDIEGPKKKDGTPDNVFAQVVECIKRDCPAILPLLNVSGTPSGGKHLRYRVKDYVLQGGSWLAKKPHIKKPLLLIETRLEGNYSVCPPTTGYTHESGPDLYSLSVLSPEQHNQLVTICRSLNQLSVKEFQRTTGQVTRNRSARRSLQSTWARLVRKSP